MADESPAEFENTEAVAVAEEAVTREPGNFWLQRRPISVAASWTLLVCGVLGMAAAIALTLDRIQLLIDPTFTPACSINPIISCGSVMVTDQGKFFGFPNPLLGLPAFAVILVTAVLSIGRVRLPRWYWVGQAIGALLGQIFVGYLIFQSIYRIHALCPYCMVVWTIIPIVLILSLSRALPDSGLGRSIREWLWILLPVYYVVVILMGTVQFWDYWKTLF
ncbi:vitamin K epoxide reductase family protein [Gordonia neofelifaecis]|uniref:Vitamin K epoxide reductase n=1 Tax=Gordonia neofelifaecis NRRL B-59395 TaxID=644548 RepID=F1YPJ9_9ACTN|nr:vitamin K epoxide reductase family protein [Gordonia neofelifaecis]EGD53394.1 vitamin K epoxide reductase [Gordonia neofelifaecis NRRL B-59395]